MSEFEEHKEAFLRAHFARQQDISRMAMDAVAYMAAKNAEMIAKYGTVAYDARLLPFRYHVLNREESKSNA